MAMRNDHHRLMTKMTKFGIIHTLVLQDENIFVLIPRSE